MGQLDGYTHPRDIDPGNLYSQADTSAIEILLAMPGLASWAVIDDSDDVVDFPSVQINRLATSSDCLVLYSTRCFPIDPSVCFTKSPKIGFQNLLGYSLVCIHCNDSFAMHQAERFVARKVDVSNAEAS